MRRNRIRSIIEILKYASKEEQQEKINNAIKNGYINTEEANEIFYKLEDMGIRKDRVRTICMIIEQYSDEKKEEALSNAVENGYITEKEKRKALKILVPYKDMVEKVMKERKDKPQYFRIAMEYILGVDNNYALRGDLTDEEKKKITEIVRKISRKEYDGRERLIIRELIPKFVTKEMSKENICTVFGVNHQDEIPEIEDESR